MHTCKITYRPFPVPTTVEVVHVSEHAFLRGSYTQMLNLADTQTLSKLCTQFRASVFMQTGHEDPHLSDIPGLPEADMDRAFKDYAFARAKLIQHAVCHEYIADSGFDLPPAEQLAKALQDLARLACAVTNQDGFIGHRYDYHIAADFAPSDMTP